MQINLPNNEKFMLYKSSYRNRAIPIRRSGIPYRKRENKTPGSRRVPYPCSDRGTAYCAVCAVSADLMFRSSIEPFPLPHTPSEPVPPSGGTDSKRVLISALFLLFHSHSIVAGGLEEISYTTRLTPRTRLMISFETAARKS